MTTSQLSSRLTWDSTWTHVAGVVARRSLCVRDQVGAVIVDSTQRIIATGYNGPPTGFPHGEQSCSKWCPRATVAQSDITYVLAPDYSDCPSLHAEANALSVCDRREREGGCIFVTSHVCMSCAKLIANSGLKHVYVATDDDAPHRRPTESYEFLLDCGVEVHLATG